MKPTKPTTNKKHLKHVLCSKKNKETNLTKKGKGGPASVKSSAVTEGLMGERGGESRPSHEEKSGKVLKKKTIWVVLSFTFYFPTPVGKDYFR